MFLFLIDLREKSKHKQLNENTNKKIPLTGGIIILCQGVAEGWVMASQTIYDFKFLACKEIKTKTLQNCEAIFLSPTFYVKKSSKFLDLHKFYHFLKFF